MYEVSEAFIREIESGPTVVGRADVYHGDEFVTTLVEQENTGTVDVDEEASIRWTARLALVDTDGSLVPERSPRDILNQYRSEIRLRRGVRFSDGSEELVPYGVYRLRMSDYMNSVVSVECFDRAIACQSDLRSPFVVNPAYAVEEEIGRLLRTKLPTIDVRAFDTGIASPLLILPDGAQCWDESAELAKNAGVTLSMGREGEANIWPYVVGASMAKVWEFVEGRDHHFWNLDRTLTLDDFANEIVVVGTNSTTSGVRAVARDEDESSPTFWRGPLGTVTYTEQSEKVGTVAQAQAMANGLLVKKLGPTETISFGCSPNPAIDVGDTVRVTSERLGLDAAPYVVQNLSMPTYPDGMELFARRSITTAEDPFRLLTTSAT